MRLADGQTTSVIPALACPAQAGVAGIHSDSCSGPRGWLDPGHKARDDLSN